MNTTLLTVRTTGTMKPSRTAHHDLVLPVVLFLFFWISFVAAASGSDCNGDADFAPGKVILKLAGSLPVTMTQNGEPISTGIASLDALNRKYHVTEFSMPFSPPPEAPGARLAYDQMGLGRIYTFIGSPTVDTRAMVADYAADSNVEYAEPDHVCRAFYSPNDYHYQRGEQWGLDKIHAPEAWDTYEPDHFAIVAVLDTGVDLDHPDFWWSQNQGVILEHPAECSGYAGVDDDHNGYVDDCMGFDFVNGTYNQGQNTWYNDANGPQDDHGHGTHVAGIACAISDNSVGVSSVIGGRTNPQKILPVKVLASNGWGTWDQLAAGIYYAANNHASVAPANTNPDG